ncbi:MAG: MerR family transcriptional regulator [Schwartzia sp.]|nr:MerR family transcriptional regulator [Schwartzia sp. (in: firmicutes)]
MYTMRQVCRETGMTYEGLKFYCNQGLVPNVKRDKNNRRVFDEHDLEWIKSLSCLKNCEMSIAEMQRYLAYCLEGPSSIPVRKEMLAKKQDELREKMKRLQEAVDFIDWKQQLYDDILAGRVEYHSNLTPPKE